MTILFISSNLTGLDTPVVATIMKGGHLRGACRPRRPFPNGLSRLPSPPLDSFRRREWEASFASGRSAVWRRAARPCTLGRPGVQVAKGSPVLDRGDEGVRVRVGRWQVARSARSNESRAPDGPATAWIHSLFFLFSSFPLPSREGFLRHPSSHPAIPVDGRPGEFEAIIPGYAWCGTAGVWPDSRIPATASAR